MTGAVGTGPGPSLARWRWTITTAFGLGGIAGSSWGPRLPAIKAGLGVGTGVIGLLLAGVTAGALLGLLSSALVLRWLGGRRAVTGALLLMTAAMAVMGLGLFLHLVALLAAGFVIVGLAIGVLDVSINVEAAAIEQAAGRTLMPMMHAAWSAGAAAGAGIGAACAAVGISPAVQMAGEAVLILAVALAMAPGIPAGRRDSARPPARNRKAALRQWARGWLDWRLLLIGVVMLGCELGEGSANSWLSLAVRTDHGQAAAVAALFLSVFNAAEALTRICSGRVVDRFGRVAVTRVTTALGIAGMVLFIESGTIWLVVAGTVLWAVGVSMGFPLGMSAAAEQGPDPAAQVSMVASIGYLAGLAGPPAIGFLAQSAGLLQALWLLAAMFLAACAVAGSLARKPAPQPQPRRRLLRR